MPRVDATSSQGSILDPEKKKFVSEFGFACFRAPRATTRFQQGGDKQREANRRSLFVSRGRDRERESEAEGEKKEERAKMGGIITAPLSMASACLGSCAATCACSACKTCVNGLSSVSRFGPPETKPGVFTPTACPLSVLPPASSAAE